MDDPWTDEELARLAPWQREALTHANSIFELGKRLRQEGRLAAAEPFLRFATETRQQIIGRHHVVTAAAVNELALVLADFNTQPQLGEAEALLRQLLDDKCTKYGPHHLNEDVDDLHQPGLGSRRFRRGGGAA